MEAIDVCCANCAHWDSKDSLSGYCEEITEALRLTPLRVNGLHMCETSANGHCQMFDASSEAIKEADAEEAYMADLRSDTGTYYPASLTCAGRGRS